MFIWRADTVLDKIQKHLPEAYEAFAPVRDAVGTKAEEAAVEQAFRQTPRISIDYGVMERAKKVYVVPGSFGWSDVGDWRAVYEHSEKDEHGNALHGNVIVYDASRCFVQADDRLVVLVGMHDAIVVDTDDALLVCNRENAQRVKQVVEYLHAHQLDEYV
jgi:mannose-1-phosphate guanylyltransferase